MAHTLKSQVVQVATAQLIARVATLAAFLLIASVVAGLAQAQGQDRRQNEPGQFDFYVLSLSWSPSFCDAAAERSAETAARQPECGDRHFAFVVQGLWPQYEHGFPEFCQNPAPRLDRTIISSMLDVMPSPRLIFRQWDRHGVCSGLPAHAYFETIRRARAMIKIPPAYLDLAEPAIDAKADPKADPKVDVKVDIKTDVGTVAPNDVEEAFIAANPGLTHSSIAVGCDAKRLNEVRICLSKDLKFRDCAEVDQRACRLEQVQMPRVRGG